MKSIPAIRLLTMLCGWMLWACPAEARTYTAASLPFTSALPSREITSLHQDREGAIWIGTTHGVARYDGYATVVFKSDHARPGRLTDNSITLVADTEHRVLVGTQNGLNVFDKQTWTWQSAEESPFAGVEIKFVFVDGRERVWVATPLALYRCDEQLQAVASYDLKASVTSVYEDRSGRLWVLTWGRGMFRWDEKNDRFIACPPVGKANIPFVLYQDLDGHHWLGTWGDGLFRFHPERSDSTAYEPQDAAGGICFDIEQDQTDGRLWMLTYDSLSVFDRPSAGRLRAAETLPDFDRGRMFSTLLRDRSGNLWLGAFDDGYLLTPVPDGLTSWPLEFIKATCGFDANLNCMYEDAGGVLWFNQERGGVGFFDRRSGRHALHPYSSIRNFEVNFIVPSRRPCSAWMASEFVPSVFRAERKGLSLQFTDTLRLAADGAETGHVLGILEDSDGRLWALTERRHFVFDRHGHSLPTDLPADMTAVAMAEDSGGRVWLAGADGRFCALCPEAARMHTVVRTQLRLPVGDRVGHICCAEDGTLWVATALGGLYCWHPSAREWDDHTVACLPGMPPVISLVHSGRTLWVVTPGAVVRYDPAGRTRRVFAAGGNHVPVQAFRGSAACLSHDGQFYAGGHGGFVAIDMARRVPATAPLPVRLTDLQVNGRSLLLEPDGENRVEGSSVVLSPSASRMAFSFSLAECPAPTTARLAYCLDGMGRDTVWLEPGSHRIFFDRLPRGTYALSVWATDENGLPVGPATVYSVTKQPAWYETWAAFAAYAVLALALCFYGLRWYVLRVRQKNARLLREEMARTKLEYFTNMSHELLTPLTILSCAADEIGGNSTVDPQATRSLRDNVQRLKKLIHQVLDFRKVEARSLPLQVGYADVASFVRRIAQADFDLMAKNKGIQFRADIYPGEIYGFFDADKLEEMLFNLLSNAVKYTEPGRSVGVKVRLAATEGAKRLQLDVWDEGAGIAPEEQDKVFNRFYRSPQSHGTESNGIGLSLTRQLAALHHGTLSLRSAPGEGSCFTIELPLDEEAYTDEERQAGTAAPASDASARRTDDIRQDGLPALLVVDDNAEITDSIGRLMGGRYRILAAHSAAQARSMLQCHGVDLMVCDLKMPGMDGLDFCRSVKNDVATSHIPVVVLTAQNSEETRAACYEAGADGFVAKPFETSVLTARIDNLLHLYRQRGLQFLHAPEADTSMLPYRDRDKAFLEELVQTVEGRLSQSELSLDALAAELRLSKSTMNRKIKSMTGLTPMDFVKGIRLRAACRLLRRGGQTVAEVAYAVGFSDPKYFTKCFKEAYGQTPTQFQAPSDGI